MKKLFIFALFIYIATLLSGCEKTEYKCTSTLIWEDEGGKAEGRGWEIKSTSSKETMDAALKETLGKLKEKYPKATNDNIYISCWGGDERATYGTKPCEKNRHGHINCRKATNAKPKPKKKKSKSTRSEAKSKAKQKQIRFGCRAFTQTSKGSRRSIYHNSNATSHNLAITEVRTKYKEKYPDAHNFESNCWPCDLPRLDEDGQIVCEQHSSR